MQKWTANHIPDQTGTVFLITGANSGLGYESTLALARKNATVVMACRNPQKGEAARRAILKQVPGAELHLMPLDLSRQSQVREFAKAFLTEYERLDVLMNNAGVMAIPRRETEDGFEMQLAVNHLGHFALTGYLLDLLLNTPASRVVNISSGYQFSGRLHFDDLMLERNYAPYRAYGQTKLANVVFTAELQRRLAAINADTISVACHPGYAATNLQPNAANSHNSVVQRALYAFSNTVFAQPAAMGALPQLYAATAPAVQGGEHFSPHFMSMRGYPVRQKMAAAAYDPEIGRRLWEVSEELTGVSYEALAPQYA